MAKFKKESGWLRRAQDEKRRVEEARRLAEHGPVTSLPVPDGDAQRVTAAELEEST